MGLFLAASPKNRPRAAAAVMSGCSGSRPGAAADYDSLIETLEILADEAAVAGLVEARREVVDGVWCDTGDATEARRRVGVAVYPLCGRLSAPADRLTTND
ncbi:MAG: hypothetical protein LBD77_08545 [Bifidobacteriaceae bacterium]|jgi:hypothetical protein|nr:hypothetical protein [Bifidobacteriaceae bacterium]